MNRAGEVRQLDAAGFSKPGRIEIVFLIPSPHDFFSDITVLSPQQQSNEEHQGKGMFLLCKVQGELLVRKLVQWEKASDNEIDVDRRARKWERAAGGFGNVVTVKSVCLQDGLENEFLIEICGQTVESVFYWCAFVQNAKTPNYLKDTALWG